jgi:hypothetical protein
MIISLGIFPQEILQIRKKPLGAKSAGFICNCSGPFLQFLQPQVNLLLCCVYVMPSHI